MNKIYFENIPFNKYIVHPKRGDYDTAIKFGIVKAEDIFEIGDIMELSFGEVKDIQYLVNYGCDWKQFIEWVANVKDIELEIIGNTPVFDVIQGRQYVIEQVVNVNKMESDNLGHEPTVYEQRANIARFQQFKSFPQMDQLTKGMLWMREEIRNTPYMLCYMKLFYDSERTAYQADYNRIIARKNKHNG